MTAGYRRNARRSNGSRSPVLARNGMVSTSQPLATAAGLRLLQQGGNAVDAAVAAAAVLGVVEPMMTGVGGDVFALVFWSKTGDLIGLNASGRAPARMTAQYLRGKGYTQMPAAGVDTITVPGAVDGWCSLLERFGSLSPERIFSPAIEYAEKGFPVSEVISNLWRDEEEKLRLDGHAAATYLPHGKAPLHGEIASNPHLGGTLRLIASGGRGSFYRGKIAQSIAEAVRAAGGVLTAEDMAEHRSEWVRPISSRYKEYELQELPPNGQGLAALEMLNLLRGFPLRSMGHNSAEYLHLMVEAKKLAFADRDKYVADPDFARIPVDMLLSERYAAERRKHITPDRAQPEYAPGDARAGDTVYLAVVDGERNAVSFINSLFGAFGSGIVAGDTGICLQSRGAGFKLDDHSWNRVEPRKRPLHTIIPAMVTRDGKPCFVFGVVGADNQPQAHVQVFLNLVEFGMNVQEAGEAARFRHTEGQLALEPGVGADVRQILTARGHNITPLIDDFGGYQGILIDTDTNVLMGGSDPRKDGCALGW